MPRLARLDAPGVLHHVMGRGIERKNIFWNKKDRQDFIDRLGALGSEKAMDIYAWSVIPNHFHLLIKTRNRPLASSMKKLLTGYVVNFNKRHNRHGHLFQNRYKSIVCQEDVYLKELVRYIHLNLVRAQLVKNIEELNTCSWSGHASLMGKQERQWQDTEYVLSYFGKGEQARKKYLEYVKQGIKHGHRPELVGGGLIRSLGGWSEVLALRKKGEKQAYDQRILGEGDFVEQIKTNLDNFVMKNLRLSGQRIDISELAERVCQKKKVSINELCSGSRRKKISEQDRSYRG